MNTLVLQITSVVGFLSVIPQFTANKLLKFTPATKSVASVGTTYTAFRLPLSKALWGYRLRVKVLASISIILLVALIAYLFTGWEECSFEEEYATERIIDVLNRASLEPDFLSAPSFQKEDCSYSYMYKDESNKIHYIFTGWGEVHKWDYVNGEGP